MAEPILIYGKSGSGKSRSLKNFAEDEIFFVNVISKRLPFPKKFKYEARTSDYEIIKNQLSKMPCKVAVIDDAGYLMTNTFMTGHSNPKGGASTFDLFNTIGDQFWSLIQFIKKALPEDVRVYFMMHEISNDTGEVKVRTIGKFDLDRDTIDKSTILAGAGIFFGSIICNVFTRIGGFVFA